MCCTIFPFNFTFKPGGVYFIPCLLPNGNISYKYLKSTDNVRRYNTGVATPGYDERKRCGHKGFAAFDVTVNIATNNISSRDRPMVSRRFRVYLKQTSRFTDFSTLPRYRRSNICGSSVWNGYKTDVLVINIVRLRKQGGKFIQ